MSILIKKATILNASSNWHQKQVDVWIKRGKIEKIAKNITEPAKEIIQGENLFVSASWVDIGCRINEPGFEHRERGDDFIQSALKGGYGVIAPFPNTEPVIDNKSSIEYLKRLGKKHNIKLLPIGAVSHSAKGEDLAELNDMAAAGTTIFSDGIKGIQNNGLLLRALQYSNSFNGLVINAPYSAALSKNGQLHEGIISTLNGTTGIPSMAEFTVVDQQLAIASYAESDICFYGLSTKESVKSIKSHKNKDLNVYSVVPYLNLIYTDEALASFDSSLKVLPPLRSKEDQKELIKGLKDGVITAISSNHTPFDLESKDLEFYYAAFGASGIETTFAALNTFAQKLPLDTIIRALTTGPRSILKLFDPVIQEGEKANMTVFSSTHAWTFDSPTSSAINNPFLGKTLKGKVLRTII